jgi:glycosyltransferase involved in cell wall biosynthesis
VSPEEGYLVPMGTRAEIVDAFRRRLEALAADPSELERRGARARERVRECYTWDAKARRVLDIYEWVLGRRPERPDSALRATKVG